MPEELPNPHKYHVILEEQQIEVLGIILNVSHACESALQRNTMHLHLCRTFLNF